MTGGGKRKFRGENAGFRGFAGKTSEKYPEKEAKRDSVSGENYGSTLRGNRVLVPTEIHRSGI